jgi:2-polyprenyl-3-methyl-5-hydroxy-6-metoxy-1,4-benzoquinol methylase
MRELQRIGASGRVLDFGAGTGELTRRLADAPRFTRIEAVDLLDYAKPADPRIHWHYADLNEPTYLPAASYDTVVASEVIEHLENPRAVAREWARLLKPRGHLVVSTPATESLRSILSLLVQGHFVAFTEPSYPAHITALVRTDLRRILAEAGFNEISFAYTDRGGIPKMPHRSWQSISFGLLRGLRFSDNLVISAVRR